MSTLKHSFCLAGMIVINPLLSQAGDAMLEERIEVVIDRSKNAQTRIAAVKSLGKQGDPRAIEPLILVYQNLSDPDPLLETTIRKVLEELKAVDYLQVKLKGPKPEVREKAAVMLGVLGNPDGAGALITALKDPVPKVREESATALAKLGLAKSVAGLIAILEGDEVAEVRMAAAQALGCVGTPEARTALERAAKTESDDFVKVMIRMSLSADTNDARP
jgi:HEAT repeat protein